MSETEIDLSGYGYVSQMYPRHGGLMQSRPLTEEEQKYDDTCRAIDTLETEIGNMSAALFTAAELLWLSGFVTKVFFAAKQDQLDRQLLMLTDLRNKLSARSLTNRKEPT